MKLNNNDDSHNSGLNLLIYNMLLDIESHPAWVCGLKLVYFVWLFNWIGHTLRGCVDWNKFGTSVNKHIQSHTLRGCVDWNKSYALRYSGAGGHTLRGCVDWNSGRSFDWGVIYVTPCVGVWIETSEQWQLCIHTWSHPAWVCGLKQPVPQTSHSNLLVTPCVGVWIETRMARILSLMRWSHPAWVCGLKLIEFWTKDCCCSHTLRGCVDWNWEACAGYIMDVVTPCVGVWIETMTRWIRV